jgi:hypothetical protein
VAKKTAKSTPVVGKVEGLEMQIEKLEKEVSSALARNEELENLLAESEASRTALRERKATKVNDEEILAAIEHNAQDFDPNTFDSSDKSDKSYVRIMSHLYVNLMRNFEDRRKRREEA